MLPEFGQFAILLALAFALIQAGSSQIRYVKSAAYGQCVFLGAAMFILILSFIANDISVLYVRDHSHALLPLIYRIGAAWGGHEGSLLLWCWILSAWTMLFIFLHYKKLAPETFCHINRILGALSAGFILFLFCTSNPFKRDFPTTFITGQDLTPILQDPGLIFHPPMLYLGYVGFAIGFAFALTALFEKKLTAETLSAFKPWVILPWAFLSCGIVLGSSWAYRELGWGGFWFWDPVENASLLPWLSSTALIHSLTVSEKRKVFQGWTLLLALVTFALSLLGTFLVRSGVLVSVHAFASDPTRGLFLLAYLTLLIGGSFAFYGARVRYFFKAPTFALLSRETFLLMNSVLLLTAVFTIILGTLYPIALETLHLEKISVGAPYFNTVFVPLMLPLLFLMGAAPHIAWKKESWQALWKKCRLALLLSVVISVMAPIGMGFPIYLSTSIGIALGVFIILGTLFSPARFRKIAMTTAHLGIAMIVLGITFNQSYSEERQVKMHTGEAVSLAGYDFTFDLLAEKNGPNYQSKNATFLIRKKESFIAAVTAEERIYKSHGQRLSLPGITANLWRDLYVALGSELPNHDWTIRFYYKPGVRWIWFGGFMLLLGGVLSLLQTWISREKREYL